MVFLASSTYLLCAKARSLVKIGNNSVKWSPQPPGGQSLHHFCSTRLLQAQHRSCLRLPVSELYSDMPTFTTALVSRQAFRVGSVISAQKGGFWLLVLSPMLLPFFGRVFWNFFCLFCCNFSFYYCWLWIFGFFSTAHINVDLEGNINVSALLSGPEGCNSSLLTNCSIVTTSSSDLTDRARRNYCLALCN